ncbi:MAG: 50S ribosomal protein L17 [Patescibacteria group bacterium]
MPNALSRKKDYRNNLLRNLATSLVLYEHVRTTKAKAKAVKPIVEHLFSIAKRNDLSAKRTLMRYFFDENAVKKIFEVLLPRYKKINSGFIKSYRFGSRVGDNAEIIILELIEGETVATKITPQKLEEVKNKVKVK